MNILNIKDRADNYNYKQFIHHVINDLDSYKRQLNDYLKEERVRSDDKLKKEIEYLLRDAEMYKTATYNVALFYKL